MNKKEAEDFISNHLPFMVKDKNGKGQYPYKSVNAHKQIAKHLVDELVKANSVLGGVVNCEHDFNLEVKGVGLVNICSKCKELK